MKAEERKELVTNDLARWVNDLIQHPKESIPTRWYWIGGGILLVIALVFVYRWASTSSSERDAGRWAALAVLNRSMAYHTDPAQIEAFAKENPDSEQARMLRFEQARSLLPAGMRDLGSPGGRADAVEKLKKARDLYDKLAGERGVPPDLLAEALLVSGEVSEALGEYDRAKANYTRVKKEFPQTVRGRTAEERLTALENADAVKAVDFLRPAP